MDETQREDTASDAADQIRGADLAAHPDFLRDAQPGELATIVECVPREHQVEVFLKFPPELRADMFEYLEWPTQHRFARELAPAELGSILDRMAPDDRTALLGTVSAEERAQLLALMSPDQRAVAESLLTYPEDSVGRLMTPDYLDVEAAWTVRQVLDHIRAHGRDSETLNAIYVVDAKHKLLTDVRVRELLLAPLDKVIGEVTNRPPVTLSTSDTKDRAVQIFRKYDRTALPVVDTRGILIGIVTVDDVLDVAEEEATREIQQFGGLEALEDPYMRTPVLPLVRKRAGWLVILFVGEMFTATAMGFFETEIERAVVLALFVPLIISSGGNSGSQAATLIIRALAVGELKLSDWWLVARREVISGLLLGCILGTIGFFRIAIWSAFSEMYGPHWLLVALTVAFSLIGIVLWGTLSGSMLPLVLKRLGMDPATSSAPFVATLVDVTGLIIYFSVAIIFLHGTLL